MTKRQRDIFEADQRQLKKAREEASKNEERKNRDGLRNGRWEGAGGSYAFVTDSEEEGDKRERETKEAQEAKKRKRALRGGAHA
jgi:hypothetical protein